MEMLLSGFLLPAVVAAAVVWASGRCCDREDARRWSAAAGLALALIASWQWLPRTEWIPDRHWHWLPWLGGAAAVLSSVSLAAGVVWWERTLVFAGLAAVAAVLIVPDWQELQPVRTAYWLQVGGSMLALMLLLDPLAVRLPARDWWMSISLTALVQAVMIALFVSLIYGRAAGAIAGGLCGCAVTAWAKPSVTARGVVAGYAVLVGGVGFVGAIEPRPPLVVFQCAGAAPLLLWLSVWGPISRLSPRLLAVARLVLVLLPLVIVTGILIQHAAAQPEPQW